jgi:asparagine synthase (glutamine-hydrolysing)
VLDSYRKVGFNAPIEDLLDVTKNEVREQILDDSPVYDIVNKNSIEKILKNKKLENSDSKFLFSFLGTKFFLEKFKG